MPVYPRYLQVTGAMVYQPSLYKIFTRECNIKPRFTRPWLFEPYYTSMALWQFTIGGVIAILLCINLPAHSTRHATMYNNTNYALPSCIIWSMLLIESTDKHPRVFLPSSTNNNIIIQVTL